MTKKNTAKRTDAYRHIYTSQQSLGVYPGATDAAAWKAYTSEESDTPRPEAHVKFSRCVILPWSQDVWEQLGDYGRLLVCSGMPVHPMDEYDTIQHPGVGELEIVTTPGDLEWALAYLSL